MNHAIHHVIIMQLLKNLLEKSMIMSLNRVFMGKLYVGLINSILIHVNGILVVFFTSSLISSILRFLPFYTIKHTRDIWGSCKKSWQISFYCTFLCVCFCGPHESANWLVFFYLLFGCPTVNFGLLLRGQFHSPNVNHFVLSYLTHISSGA